jgi:hypothetical protein
VDDQIFVLILMSLLAVTALVIFRGHRQTLSTEERRKIDELNDRVKVLEQIVTDGGAATAAQIEALRDRPHRAIE